jgi:CheY-like chemotaxis protein
MPKLRILVMDAEDACRRACTRRLGSEGHLVDSFGEALPALLALRKAQREGEPYHQVVLDPLLPDLDGVQVLNAIRACCPDVPVLLFTGLDCERLRASLALFPRGAVLGKPLPPAGVLAGILALQGTGVSSQPRPVRKAPRSDPALHEGAYLLVKLAPSAAAGPIAHVLSELAGCCYCERVEGRWDLIGYVQATDRRLLQARLERPMGLLVGVERWELLELRPPVLEASLWPMLADAAATRGGPPAPGSRDAYLLMEIEPERSIELFLRVSLMGPVVHCDLSRDRSVLVVLVRDWPHGATAFRVPDWLRLLPGVHRVRALPLCVEAPAVRGPAGLRGEEGP